MSAEANKQLVRAAYEAVSKGDLDGFMSRLSDDIRWVMTGSHRFAKTFKGKADLLENLFAPLGEALEGGIRIELDTVVGEGDRVVVEARGKAATKSGGRYDNVYCNVLTVRGGKIVEIHEYLDTELVSQVFGKLR
ncbi:MAG: nuclear transport factor 2 family protein [Nevskia sp.]|nr:nuclear transport factor 2 family protein [Nevskia sp.]